MTNPQKDPHEEKISVETISDTTFRVTVTGKRVTTHTVMLTSSYYQALTNGVVSPELLVEKSFRFLLERESNASILSSFDLFVIGQYFPEYESTIRRML